MHELLLFGQVPPNRHSQLLKILAGVAAMQPHVITERHLVFKPRRPITNTTRAPPKPGSQTQTLQAQMQGDLFSLQLVGNVTASGSPEISDPSTTNGTLAERGSESAASETWSEDVGKAPAGGKAIDFTAHPWSLEFRDLPEVPGRRPVTSRVMASVPIMDGDPLGVMDPLGYVYTSEYVLQGHRLIHGNIILLLHRPLMVPPVPKSEQNKTSLPHPVNSLPPLESLRPLDPSGGYILQASIRVQDGNKPETMTLAMSELVRFRELMKGVVDMEVGDRLALDTRMR